MRLRPLGRRERSYIAFLIAGELRQPVIGASGWTLGKSAAAVLMPEAPMYEDRLPSSAKHDVGAAWKVSGVKSVPHRTQLTHQTTYNHFWSRIRLAYAAHHARTHFR